MKSSQETHQRTYFIFQRVSKYWRDQMRTELTEYFPELEQLTRHLLKTFRFWGIFFFFFLLTLHTRQNLSKHGILDHPNVKSLLNLFSQFVQTTTYDDCTQQDSLNSCFKWDTLKSINWKVSRISPTTFWLEELGCDNNSKYYRKRSGVYSWIASL